MAEFLSSAYGISPSNSGAANRAALATLWNTTAPDGSVILLDGYVPFAGSAILTRTQTLRGVGAGAGLNIVDPEVSGVSIDLRGNGSVFDNLNIVTNDFYSQGKVVLRVQGDDVKVRYVKMQGCCKQLELYFADRTLTENCFFTNPFGVAQGFPNSDAIALVSAKGKCHDARFYRSVWRLHHSEMFKSVSGNYGGVGMVRPVFEECIFADGGRDGIDSTGGFAGISFDDPARVLNCIFMNLSMAFDWKMSLRSDTNGLEESASKFIIIDGCEFYGMGTVYMCTHLQEDGQKYTTSGNNDWKKFVRNIRMQNCFYDAGNQNPRLTRIKSGRNIEHINISVRGAKANFNHIDGASFVQNTLGWDPAPAAEYGSYSPKLTESGVTYAGATLGKTWSDISPVWTYGPQDNTTPDPSTDPLYVRSGAEIRLNTDDANAVGAHMLSVSVANASGRARRAATLTVNPA